MKVAIQQPADHEKELTNMQTYKFVEELTNMQTYKFVEELTNMQTYKFVEKKNRLIVTK